MKKPNMCKSESVIQQEIMLAIQKAWPKAAIIRQNTGASKDATGRLVRFGVKGAADLRIIINGLAIEIEAKTLKGVQSRDQKQYEKAIRRAGGRYFLCRDAGSCVNAIRESISRGDSEGFGE